jgi:hypothetical protein
VLTITASSFLSTGENNRRDRVGVEPAPDTSGRGTSACGAENSAVVLTRADAADEDRLRLAVSSVSSPRSTTVTGPCSAHRPALDPDSLDPFGHDTMILNRCRSGSLARRRHSYLPLVEGATSYSFERVSSPRVRQHKAGSRNRRRPDPALESPGRTADEITGHVVPRTGNVMVLALRDGCDSGLWVTARTDRPVW